MRNGNIQFRVFILLCIILSIAFNLTNAFGATINVPTIDYPTIQAGIDAAVDGDTVLVADGTYTGAGNKNLDFNGKAITVISENGPNNTIIDCENDGNGFLFNSDETENSILSGFTITNGNATAGGGIYCYRSSPTITDCIIRGNKADSIGGGGIHSRYSSPSITKCIIRDNSSAGPGGGILSSGGSTIIANCVINGNIAETFGGGIHITGSSSSKITNCTISGNSALNGGGGISVGWGASPSITNCILWANTLGEIYHDDNTNAVITYCNVQGGHTGEGNFEGDPLFVDAENNDFHLLNNSPCMYAATATGAPDTDIEGNSRPQGYGFDMGAYETTGYDKLRPIVDSFSADVTEGIVPFDVTFTCEAHDTDGEIISYNMNYGDGSASETNTSGIFAQTYTLAGSGYATCTVTDDSGASTNSTSIIIRRSSEIHVPANYATIQAAIDAASDGDTITVASGTYKGEGNKNLDFKGKAITVISENGPENTIIDCENDGRGFIFQNGEGQDSVVSGFTITNGKAGSDGGGIYIYDASPTISNCIIKNCRTKYTTGDYYGGGIYCRAYSSTNPIYPVIQNSVIANNKSGRRGGGIYCYGSNTTIANCTIVNNSTDNSFDASGGGIYGSYSSLIITNSIIWSNYPNAVGSTATVAYSNIEGGRQGEGNIDLYPELVDPLNGNYRLKDYSPCIGTGTVTGAPVIDIIGGSRPNPPGSNPDIGAYENSLAIPVPRPLDVFAIEMGNLWNYQVTSQTGTYTREEEVMGLDERAYSFPTYIVEARPENGPAEQMWYEKTTAELRLWKTDFYWFDYVGLLICWYPMQVNDHKYTKTTTSTWAPDPTVPFDVSLTVDVLAKESVNLGFDTFEAYKLRYILRVWGYGEDNTDTFYYWWVPYLGFIKYQDNEITEVLTSFAIYGGTITKDTDTDSDGLKDYQEVSIYNTDRLDSDTDDDSLTDGDEVNTYGTDPNNIDSDNDGLNDGDEVNAHNTDPTNTDTDNDGLSDGDEINTYSTDPLNEDSDDDGLNDGDEVNTHDTDPTDPDTDGDGLTDGEEVNTHGTDPNKTDTDGDGISDKDEVDSGRHPANWEPNKPELYLPPDGEPDVSITAELETDPFSDPDGDDHDLTQWQIGKRIGNPEPCSDESFTNSDYIVFDGASDTQLTLFNVPDLLLDASTNYCWRARVTDTGFATSDWSDPFSFSTIAQVEDDQDPQNGIPDNQEADCLAIFDDEIPQDTVCVDTLAGNAQVGIEPSTNVVSIEAFRSVDPQDIPENLQGVELLIGLMSFKAEVEKVGDIMEITFHSSVPMPFEAQCYKYDPVNGWQNYSAHIVAISADRKSITLEYKDGDFGDLDGVANKIVIDPVGFGINVGGGGGGGGSGGGCLISSAADGFRMPKESLALLLVFGFLLIGLLAFRKRLRKYRTLLPLDSESSTNK